MHSAKIVALAAGLIGALLSTAPVDAYPVNSWGGVRGGPHYAWHPNAYAWHRNHGSTNFLYGSHHGDYWLPYSDYWPHSDYWPPYAGWDCVGSLQWKNAFC